MSTLSFAVALVESSNDQFALRFEPAMFQSKPIWVIGMLPKILTAHPNMSRDTALMLACSSFGYYQILGANIWSGGFTGKYNEYLSNLTVQFTAFDNFVKQRGFSASEDISKWSDERYANFATFYNGPGASQNYIDALKKNAQ
jgi:hypothetical protein